MIILGNFSDTIEILTGPVESIALAFVERLLRLADRYSPEELERGRPR